MPNTFELIASSTVGSGGAASITISSIPSTYTDLQLIVTARGTANGAGSGYFYYLYPNGATTNLTTRYLYGQAASAGSGSSAPAYMYMPASDYTASTFSNDSIYLPNYAGSTYKSYSIDSVNENNASGGGSAYAVLSAGLWSVTTAISSLTLTPGGGNFAQYSTAYLYGVKNA